MSDYSKTHQIYSRTLAVGTVHNATQPSPACSGNPHRGHGTVICLQVRGIAQQDSFLSGGVAIGCRTSKPHVLTNPPARPYVSSVHPEEMSLIASRSASSSLQHPLSSFISSRCTLCNTPRRQSINRHCGHQAGPLRGREEQLSHG